MIDGIRAYPNARAGHLLRTNPLLTWSFKGLNRQGQARYQATWGSFVFTGDGSRCTQLRGSLHKHFAEGENWTDFTRAQVVDAIVDLCHDLGLHPASFKLANVEVGVNITPPTTACDALQAIVLHKTQNATPLSPGRGLVIEHDAFRFKIYDKGLQYNLPRELLRVEVAVRKMRALAGHRVWTLADLLQPETWDALCTYLNRRCNELLIVECAPPPTNISLAEVQLWVNAANPAYWVNMSKQRRSERRKQLDRLYNAHVGQPMKGTFCDLVRAKLIELTAQGPTDFYTDGAETASRTFAPMGAETHYTEGDQRRTSTPLVVNGAEVLDTNRESQVPRTCATCGRDISRQRVGSKYCSEKFAGRDGKSCRNRASNATRGLRQLDRYGPALFDSLPFTRTTLGLPRRRHHPPPESP